MQTPNDENDLEQGQVQPEDLDAPEGQNDPQAEEAKTDLEVLEENLEAAQLATGQAKDDLLRVQAEMQNLRRRSALDVEKAHKFGQDKLATELLAVMDNLERALSSASDSEDEVVKAIYDGVDITLKSFATCFAKFSIVAVDPLGEPFDPLLHQAMSMQENPDVEPNTVIAVMQKGYSLHGRVIRPAMVMVSKGPSPSIDAQA
ncbi:MAG: molecular chaperone GrpE [Pseudohongiellaceae bacterium]|jgi:molecular chaperone GrpE